MIGVHYLEKEGILVSHEEEGGDEGFPAGANKRWFHSLEDEEEKTDYDLRMIGEVFYPSALSRPCPQDICWFVNRSICIVCF